MSISLKFLLVLVQVLFFILPSFAEDAEEAENPEQDQKLYVSSPSQLIASRPGGRKLGEVYVNTPVTVLEEKGDWSKVSIDVWIRSKALMSKAKKKLKKKINTNFLEVSEYSTRLVKDGLPSPRVYLSMKIKNISKVEIYSWSALLVAQKEGQVLFREPLADDTKNIAPGATVELQFYWEENEKPFAYLDGVKNGDLELGFFKTKVNR